MNGFSKDVIDLATEVLDAARARKMRIVTAESCTGGLIAASLTEIAGSSDVFDRGFVSYSYDAKMAQLDVERRTVTNYGAVSGETAVEMAEGALRNSHADVAVAVTGIAGPSGGTEDKPVGLVYIAVSSKRNHDAQASKNNFTGDRGDVRQATLRSALTALKLEIEKAPLRD